MFCKCIPSSNPPFSNPFGSWLPDKSSWNTTLCYDTFPAENSARIAYCPQKETRVNSLAFKGPLVLLAAHLREYSSTPTTKELSLFFVNMPCTFSHLGFCLWILIIKLWCAWELRSSLQVAAPPSSYSAVWGVSFGLALLAKVPLFFESWLQVHQQPNLDK